MLLAAGRVDAVAGVKPQVEAIVRAQPGTRLVPGAFMTIRQAMATGRTRAAGARYLADFVDHAKASGFVRELFERNDVQGGTLAP